MSENISEEDAKKLSKEAEKSFKENQEKYSKSYDESTFLKIVRNLPRIITEPFITLYYVMKHPDIPTSAKVMCLATLGYVVLPFDFIPDFIPALGWMDDIAIVGMALKQLKTWADSPWVLEKVQAFYDEV